MTINSIVDMAAELAANLDADHVIDGDMRVHAAVPIAIPDISADGTRVVVRHGECFGHDIDWSDETVEVDASVTTDPKTGLPMLSYPLSMGHRAEYRGLESDGKTWWRYAHEVDPNQYREHCLRVIGRV